MYSHDDETAVMKVETVDEVDTVQKVDASELDAHLMAVFLYARGAKKSHAALDLPITDPDIARILSAHAQLQSFYDAFAELNKPRLNRSRIAFSSVREVARTSPSPDVEKTVAKVEEPVPKVEKPELEVNCREETKSDPIVEAKSQRVGQAVAGTSSKPLVPKLEDTEAPPPKVFQKARRSKPQPLLSPLFVPKNDENKPPPPKVHQKARRSRPEEYQHLLPPTVQSPQKPSRREEPPRTALTPKSKIPAKTPSRDPSRPLAERNNTTTTTTTDAAKIPSSTPPTPPVSFLNQLASKPPNKSKIRKVKVYNPAPAPPSPKPVQKVNPSPARPVQRAKPPPITFVQTSLPTPEPSPLPKSPTKSPTKTHTLTEAESFFSSTAHCAPRIRRNVIDLSPSPAPAVDTNRQEVNGARPPKKGVARVIKTSGGGLKRTRGDGYGAESERKRVRFEEVS